MFYPRHQLRVSPLHESIQVCPCWGGHRDQVTIRPYLQPHQSNKGPQRFVDLKKTTLEMSHYTSAASSYCRTVCSTACLYWYGICIEIAKKTDPPCWQSWQSQIFSVSSSFDPCSSSHTETPQDKFLILFLSSLSYRNQIFAKPRGKKWKCYKRRIILPHGYQQQGRAQDISAAVQ